MRDSVIDRKERGIRTRHRPEVPATVEGEIDEIASAISTADIAAHVALTDPHTQYQKESEKDQNNGYLGGDANARLASTRLHVSATDRLVGRSTAAAGASEEIPCTSAGRALIDDADVAAQRTTLGLGSLATQSTVATADIDNDAATYAKIQNVSATDKVLGRSSAGAGDVEEITCTAAARSVLDDATVAAMLTTLGVEPYFVHGTSVLDSAADVNGPVGTCLSVWIRNTTTGDSAEVRYFDSATPTIVAQNGTQYVTAAPGAGEVQIKNRTGNGGVAFRTGADNHGRTIRWTAVIASEN